MTAEPVPGRLMTPGCGAYVLTGAGGAPRQCSAPATHAGLALKPRPRRGASLPLVITRQGGEYHG